MESKNGYKGETMSKKDECGNCLFFDDKPEAVPDGGFCRCFPPTAIIGMTQAGPQALGSTFPPTQRKSWCGEWRQGNMIKLSTKMPLESIPFPSVN